MPTLHAADNQYRILPVLADLGYQGIQRNTDGILPYKKRKTQPLSEEQKSFNKKHRSARVLVENFFGRMKNEFLAVA
jgi:hypothetical protein